MYQIYILLFDSGHYYIGRSKNHRIRYTVHKRLLRINTHPNKYMQRVYHLHGIPKCILLTHCIDCFSVEQALITFNYGKNKCLNLSSNSTGGDGKNSIPPSLTRDDLRVCNIKTKDFSNLTKLLKMLPAEKVAKYYKVHVTTIYNICKKQNLSIIKTLPRKRGHLGYLKLSENQILEFILYGYILDNMSLAIKYKVGTSTINNWRKIYQVYRNKSIKLNNSGEVKLLDLIKVQK